MEEILSSIKKIIAEDSDESLGARTNRRAAMTRDSVRSMQIESPALASVDEEVLELTDSVADAGEAELTLDNGYIEAIEAVAPPAPVVAPAPAPRKRVVTIETTVPTIQPASITPAPAEPARAHPVADGNISDSIVSDAIGAATRASLASLSSAVARPAAPAETTEPSPTLDALVRDMLRPMLKDWLDANLPTMVESMVAKEIARITGRAD